MIYLDNAASTPPAPEVLDAVARAAAEHFANPSSAHALGAAAARAVEEARREVAALLRAEAADIVFTSGGTEANALGVVGAAVAARGRHVVVTAIEHPAVLRSAELLATRGYQVTPVLPGDDGRVDARAVLDAVTPETAVVAVMLVNNEIGTIQPVAEIAAGLRASPRRPHLHVDAVQFAGMVPVDVAALGADSVAISGHKLHGPKGAGALWLRAGARLAPLWDGGRQERGLRSGTLNVPAVVGLGRAAALCRATRAGGDVASVRDALEDGIAAALPDSRPTVPRATPRAPHIASITLPGLPAEPLLHALEARGVYVSAGSACSSRTRGPTHVLRALGVADTDAVLRFSLSRLTRAEDVQAAVAALTAAVDEIRPLVSGGTGTRGRRSS